MGVWTKIMIQTINLKIKITKCRSTVLQLTKLRQRGQGTNDVEQYVRGLRNMETRTRVRRDIMKHKIADAKYQENLARSRFEAKYNYLKRRWGRWFTIWTRFSQIMQSEVNHVWQKSREKSSKKIRFLTNKWKSAPPAREPVHEWRGVMISDQRLEENFEAQKMEPIAESDIQLTEAEKFITTLPPKHTVYSPINVLDMAIEAEIMIDKLRWDIRTQEERGRRGMLVDWSEEEEWEEVQRRTVYDEANAKLSFAKYRVTDFPTNRYITVPEAGENVREIVFASMKSDIVRATEDYRKKNCDPKGNILNQKLDKDNLAGLDSLKKRVKDGEIFIVPTDKSGRLVVTTREKYVEAMQPHVANDDIITLEDRKTVENQLNGHTLQLGRILKLGDNHRHWDRFRKALTNKYGHIPILYGLDKNHKARQEGQPRPMRPVCGADESPNYQLCHLLSIIMTGLAGAMDEELGMICRSTEEMIADLEAVNAREDIKDLVFLSTDVTAMYPSLDIPQVAKVAAQEFLNSKLEVELDPEELGLYLAIMVDREELINLGLGDVCHTRLADKPVLEPGEKPKKIPGPKIGITTEEILGTREGKTFKSKSHRRIS